MKSNQIQTKSNQINFIVPNSTVHKNEKKKKCFDTSAQEATFKLNKCIKKVPVLTTYRHSATIQKPKIKE